MSKPSTKKKEEEDEEEDFDVDVLLRDPVVLQCEVQLFTKYQLPTPEEGGILCSLPPGMEKPWRVEMSSENLTEGGVTRVLRMSRRGAMFFCDDSTVETSMTMDKVTVLEAVYENSVWEPSDGYIALDVAPLQRNGLPNEQPDILCIIRLPTHLLTKFEQLALIFSRCTKKTAHRHQAAKVVSIVARHQIKSEISKYAAKIAEEEETRKKLLLEGGGESIPDILKPKPTTAAEAEKVQEPPKSPLDEDITAAAGQPTTEKTPGEESAALSPGGESFASGMLSPGAAGGEIVEETTVEMYTVNPFTHDLIRPPHVFHAQDDLVDMTALDVEKVRLHRDKDLDAELFTKTRALYFGSSNEERSTAAKDTLEVLLRRGRELAALGAATTKNNNSSSENNENNNPDDEAAKSTARTSNPFADNNNDDDENTSPSRMMPFMNAFAHRETTRVQKAQLDAFFQDAQAERMEEEQRETQTLVKVLADLKVMTSKMEKGFKEVREQKLSGTSAPRRRTPPWVGALPTRKPPPLSLAQQQEKMKINTSSPQEKVMNPFAMMMGKR